MCVFAWSRQTTFSNSTEKYTHIMLVTKYTCLKSVCETKPLPGHAEMQLESKSSAQIDVGQSCQEGQGRLLQVCKQQAETGGKYCPAVKQER